MKLRAALLTALLAAGAAAPAAAAPWKRVTTPDGSGIDQVGYARTADGVLHLAWHHPTGPNTEDLLHTVISPGGAVGATTPIQSGWTGFTNPALVVDPGGLRAFWGGFRSTDSSDPQREISTALSPDGGASWALQPGRSTRAAASPTPARSPRPCGRTAARCRRGPGRSAPGCTPGSVSGQPELQLHGGPAVRQRPEPRHRRRRAQRDGLVLERAVAARRAGPGGLRLGRAGRRAADDAGHGRDDDRHAGPHAARGARGRRRLRRLSGAAGAGPGARVARRRGQRADRRAQAGRRARHDRRRRATAGCGRSGTTAAASTRRSARAAPTRARRSGARRSWRAARRARCRPTGSTRAPPAARSTCSASSTSGRARREHLPPPPAARPDADRRPGPAAPRPHARA